MNEIQDEQKNKERERREVNDPDGQNERKTKGVHVIPTVLFSKPL